MGNGRGISQGQEGQPRTWPGRDSHCGPRGGGLGPPLSAQTGTSCGLEVTTASKSECVLGPRVKHPAINYLPPHGVSRLLWGPRVRGQTRGAGHGGYSCVQSPRGWARALGDVTTQARLLQEGHVPVPTALCWSRQP